MSELAPELEGIDALEEKLNWVGARLREFVSLPFNTRELAFEATSGVSGGQRCGAPRASLPHAHDGRRR